MADDWLDAIITAAEAQSDVCKVLNRLTDTLIANNTLNAELLREWKRELCKRVALEMIAAQ